MDAASFDAVAGIYSRSRPSYPIDSVEWLVGDASSIVDVGAGTGLFTRLLVAPGRTVVAVEPSAPMLAELRRMLPGVVAFEGTAERIPLPDAGADLVVLAQAWHWVDPGAAAPEVARVLRPHGRLGLVWNLRDERVAWVRALGDAMRADGDHFRGDLSDPRVGAPFGEPERQIVEWTRSVTREALLDDVRSRSYFALLDDDEQRAVIDDVVATLPDGVIELPYVTAAFRYTPR